MLATGSRREAMLRFYESAGFHAITGRQRMESGRPAASIQFSTVAPMAASVCRAAKPRCGQAPKRDPAEDGFTALTAITKSPQEWGPDRRRSRLHLSVISRRGHNTLQPFSGGVPVQCLFTMYVLMRN